MKRLVALLALLTLAASLRGTSPSQAEGGVPVPEDDPFYAVPSDIAGYRNGQVIASRKVNAHAFEVPLPARAWHVKYRTEDRRGRPTATVTTVLVPDAAWTGRGPRPLLSYQTAEDGVAGKCAPSYAYRAGVRGGFTNSYPELSLIALAIQRGWAVSVPDYEGPESQFLVAGMQAKGVLDGIRAARNFSPAGISRRAPIGLWGYSGGGLASVTAAQWQPAYAPKLRLRALAVGAPATDIRASIAAFSGSFAGGAIPMGINGFLRAYPGLHLMQYLNQSGRDKVRATSGDCINDAVARYPFLRLEDIEAAPGALDRRPVARMLRRNSPLYIDRVPRVAIYHYHTKNDELAPIEPARRLMRKLCRQGVTVWSEEKLVGEHLSEVAAGAPGALDYLAGRFAGTPPKNTCSSIASPGVTLRSAGGGAGTVATARTWYVDASAPAGGTGSWARPLRTLAAAESASRAWDTIRVLPSTRALNGGIRLKPHQTLVGAGSRVTALSSGAPAPTLTNTGSRLAGDAVRVADGATVRNLRIRDARRGAVYGYDVSGVRVVGNDISGHNASCTPGFLIPQFNAPTNVPGVGAPIVGGLQNGWAGIMIDARRRTNATASVAGNVVHDAECGDGIDVRTWGTAAYRVTIAGNSVHHLRQGPDFKSLLAIGLQARNGSSLVASVTDNRQSDLGNPDDVNLAAEGADSEGVFVNGVGPSTLRATVERNRYTNADGVGGFSANGLETVTMGDGSVVSVVVRDSSFSGSPGDVIEEGALGTNAQIRMVLERVRAERSTGVGNTWVLPFNNGDCVLAGSLGAGNDVRLRVRDSVLRGCHNNGLSVGSNVVNGTGPTKNLSVDIDRTTITGNQGGNLAIRNFTDLLALSVRVQRSDLAGSAGAGSSVADVAAEDYGTTASSRIDLGGGPLGSLGGICVGEGPVAVHVEGYAVSARRAWWGRADGPGLLSTTVVAGSLDAADPLAEAPSYC